jgi:purine nucleosidase
MALPILIDTDPGIDDSLAILLALASPELTIRGLTIVHGNCSMQQGTTNALAVLELAHASQIPVAQGCELPLVQPSLLAPETHGETGLGYARLVKSTSTPIQKHAVDFLIDTVLAEPGEIVVVAIGPLTNIAMALRKEPRLAQALRGIISMGGSINHPTNTTLAAEFNVYVDPHAAHIVYHSGVPIILTPLDVTYQCVFSPKDLQRLLRIKSPITQFIADTTRYYMEFHNAYQHIEGCVINDPLALAIAFAPELVDLTGLYVDVDVSGGISMGKTHADFYHLSNKKENMKVALRVQPRHFIELFLERIEKLAAKIPT